MNILLLNRRNFLQTQVALVVGASGAVIVTDAAAQAAAPALLGPPPTALDTWIRIAADGSVVANFGKMDCGQGLDLAIAQIVAEELDVALDKVNVTMGDTRLSPNQGGGSASTGLRTGAIPLRNAAAEARRVLVEAAAMKLGVEAVCLSVENGRVFLMSDSAKSITYA